MCLWMAPEVLQDPKECSLAADVFSIGVFLYEMATRKPPFDVDVSSPEKIEGTSQQ